MHDRTDQAHIEQTISTMSNIKKAILGMALPGEPELRDVGYIPDMGKLPVLIDGQPKGLWTADTDNDGTDDLLRRSLFIDSGHEPDPDTLGIDDSPLHIRMGWRGPYISAPRDGVLRDGWGNKLIFKKDNPDQGDLTIVSPGANGIISEKDTGSDSDIKVVIRQSLFMVPVSGNIIQSGINKSNSLTDIRLRLYYAAPTPEPIWPFLNLKPKPWMRTLPRTDIFCSGKYR